MIRKLRWITAVVMGLDQLPREWAGTRADASLVVSLLCMPLALPLFHPVMTQHKDLARCSHQSWTSRLQEHELNKLLSFRNHPV